jgi:hypothetical protein
MDGREWGVLSQTLSVFSIFSSVFDPDEGVVSPKWSDPNRTEKTPLHGQRWTGKILVSLILT